MPEQLPAYLAPTFAERKAVREGQPAETKAVDEDAEVVEDKAVAKKSTSRKRKD